MINIAAILFANLKGNLGDFAILHSMIADIRRTAPDCAIHVYSQPFVEVDAPRFEAFTRLAPPFEYRGTMHDDVKPIGPGFVRALRTVGALRLYQERRVSRLAKQAAADFGAQFSHYDAVYIAGGAQWTGVNAGVSMFANLRAIAEHNANIYSYPFSVSSSLRIVNRKASMAEDFKRIRQPLIARDSETRSALRRLGVDVRMGADCVFALGTLVDRRIAAHPAGKRLLLVLTKQSGEDIGKAITVAKAAGFHPALLTTCAEEDGTIQQAAADRAGVPFIAPLTWQDVVAEMNASAMVLTNRLHGLILTSFSSACVLPLVDREKVRAVVADAALPVSVGKLSELDEARLRTAEVQSDDIREKLRLYRERALLLPWSPRTSVPAS